MMMEPSSSLMVRTTLHDLDPKEAPPAPQPQDDAHHDAHQQTEGQAFENTFHIHTPFPQVSAQRAAHTASASHSMPKHRLIVPYFPACHKAKPVFFRKRRPAAGTRRAAKPNLFDYASTASRAAQPFFSRFLVTFKPFRARASATSWARGAIMPEHRNTPSWESTWGHPGGTGG